MEILKRHYVYFKIYEIFFTNNEIALTQCVQQGKRNIISFNKQCTLCTNFQIIEENQQ